MRCRTLDAPAPGAAGTTRPPVAYSLRRFSRLGAWYTLGGRGCERTHHRTDRITQRQPRTLFRHYSTHCSCCLGRPAARRASRWAIRILSSPQRPAAKLAPRGQARLWGTIATPTQRNATLRYATGTRWKVWERCYATGTQLDANAGYATPATPLTEGKRGTDRTGPSRLRELWATRATGRGNRTRTRHNATGRYAGLHNALPLTLS